MLVGLRKSWSARLADPSVVVLVCLALLTAAVFVYGFKYSGVYVRVLPVAALALCLALLLVPQRNLSVFLLTALGLSIPFAHFAAFVVVGEGVQWAHILGSLLIIHLVARLLLGHRIPVAPATLPILTLTAATVISVFAVIDQPVEYIWEFWKSEIQFLFAVLVFLAVIHVRLRDRQLMFLLKSMILLSAGVALFGIYQLPARFLELPGGIVRLTNPSLSGIVQVTTLIHHLTRAASIFSEPSYFGHYLVGMMALTLPAALHRPNLFGRRYILWLIILIQSTGLVLSQSVGSFYLMALLIVVTFLAERAQARKKLAGALLLMVLTGAAALTVVQRVSGFEVGQMLQERAYGIYMYAKGDESYLVVGESLFLRLDTARIALSVWLEHPIIGVGLGSYSLISYRYGEVNLFGFAANTVVNTLAETGLVGFIALTWVAISSLFGVWRVFGPGEPAPVNQESGENGATLRLAARMIFYLIAVELLYFHVLNSFFWPSTWFYLGLAGLVAIMDRRRKAELPAATHS